MSYKIKCFEASLKEIESTINTWLDMNKDIVVVQIGQNYRDTSPWLFFYILYTEGNK